MNARPESGFPTGCITSLVFYRLRRELLEMVPVARERIRPSARIEDVIPRHLRRRVWQQLLKRGYKLPPLGLSGGAVLLSFLATVARSAAFAWLFNNAIFALVALPFIALTWWITRPLAIHPPTGCQTVREAVLLATPFRKVDYDAGLWPRADISAKVRAIFAHQLGLPFDEVREDSRILDLCEC